MTLLEIVQTLTLIVLIVYVIQTWRMATAARRSTQISDKTLQEMKESRDQEVAPYVVPYFDVPHGKQLIYFVVKNVGRGVAENVRFVFQPPLVDSSGRKVSDISMIKNGIPSMPPGYEIRTFLDTTLSFFGEKKKELPLTYEVVVTYSGGLSDQARTTKVVLDLSAFEGLAFIREKGQHQLVEQVEKLVGHNKRISEDLSRIAVWMANGIWIKNPDFLLDSSIANPELWKSVASAKLKHFKTMWLSTYGGEREKLVNPFLRDFQNSIATIGAQLSAIASSSPSNVSQQLTSNLIEAGTKLLELGSATFFADGGASFRSFDGLGAEAIELTDRVIEQLNQSSLTPVDES